MRMMAKSIITRSALNLRIFNHNRLMHSFTNWSSKKVIDMAARDGELRVFMVAGEVSGDSIGSRLMSSLRKLSPFPVHFNGVGGALMCEEGFHSLFPMEDIAVMGIWELLPHLNKFRVTTFLMHLFYLFLVLAGTGILEYLKLILFSGWQIRLKETIEAAVSFKPHVVVTVDSKGFSFRFLKQLKAQSSCKDGSPVHVHYVAPSFWAWKGGDSRLKGLSTFVDHLLCVLPFEEEFCRLKGLSATYVGHPLLEDALILNSEFNPSSDNRKFQKNSDVFLRKHGISTGTTLVTLLPGSRLQEVTRMLPLFLQATEIMKDASTKLGIVIPVASNYDVKNYIEKEVQSCSLSDSAILVSGASMDQKYSAFSASHAALCTSGTAVMELQLAGLPCVVAYRAHILTEWVIALKTKLQYISLPNIMLNSHIIPEVLFGECTSKNLAAVLRKVIHDEDARQQQLTAANEVFNLLVNPLEGFISRDLCHPSMIAASTILQAEKQC